MKTEMIKKAAFTLKIVVLLFILLLSKVAKEEKEVFDSEKQGLSAVSGPENTPEDKNLPAGHFIRKVTLTDRHN